MHTYTLQLCSKTARDYELRCYAADTALPLHTQALPLAAVHALLERCEQDYKAFDSPALKRLGRDLYDWLVDLTPFDQWRQAQRDIALHIEGEAGLRHLPWELLHDGQAYLGLGAFTPVRRAAGYQPQSCEVRNRPLRVLFMASSPEDVAPVLNFEQEEARILDATRSHGLVLVVEESGSLAGLQQVIGDYPADWFDVVHLTGHADVTGKTACFWLEDEVGRKQAVTADDLLRAFDGRFPRLVFLSGCQTGQPAAGLPSLSEALVQQGVPAVLGWGLPVGDVAATQAAAVLYRALAIGQRLDVAVVAARQELLKMQSPYWHLLRLYANADPLAAVVTPLRTKGRERIKVREAAAHFLDSEQRVKVCSRAAFVGRRRVLQQALRVLRCLPGDEAYQPGLLLHGMGGLGKSSLASRLCDRLRHTHQPWVWFGAVDEDELRRVISANARRPEVNALLSEPSLTFTQQLTEVLDQQLIDPVLFVLDDFEHNAVSEDEVVGARVVPRTRADGTLVVQPQAAAALQALLQAIVDSESESRVLVTCRQRLAHVPLCALGVPSMQGAEWDKKVRAQPAFAELSGVDKALQARAVQLAAGNPRLLEWLDKVLTDTATDSAELLDRLAETVAEYREDALLDGLLTQLPSPVLRTLALLSVYALPVPYAALQALEVVAEQKNHLIRLFGLGLVEQWWVEGEDWYFASPLVGELVVEELSDEARDGVLRRAAEVLYRLWWVEREDITEIQALEIRRLAHLVGLREIAADMTNAIAVSALYGNRFREVQRWCKETLKLGEDFRLLYKLGAAEQVLGETEQAKAHLEHALLQAQHSQEERELAAVQHNLAELVAQQGNLERALQLWNQSLELLEKIGDVQGKAMTLANMALVIARQGDLERALQLWNQAHELQEKIGDVKGKAATLASMAWVAGQQKDNTRAVQLNQHALAALVEISAWLDVVTVLGHLVKYVDDTASRSSLAQALWLSMRVGVPVKKVFNICEELLQKTGGLSAEHSPLLGAAAAWVTQTRGPMHPQFEQLQQQTVQFLAVCVIGQGVAEDEEAIGQWLDQQGLLDTQILLAKLDAWLDTQVSEWWFERERV